MNGMKNKLVRVWWSKDDKGAKTDKHSSSKKNQRRTARIFLVPLICYIVLFFGYPVVKNVVMSFQDYGLESFVTGKAQLVGFENYQAILSDPIFIKALLNTVLFTVGSIVGQFVIGMWMAFFFRSSFPLSKFYRSLILLPWLVPLIVTSAIWRWILDKDDGILNQLLAVLHLSDKGIPWLTSTSVALVSIILVNIWIGIPFNFVILDSGMRNISNEYYEAAELDGATGWKAFRNITWPLLRPVVSVVLVLGVVYTLKVLDLILGLTGGGPANATQTLATQSYKLSFVRFDFGQGSALSNILIVLATVFALIYIRLSGKGEA